MFGLKGKTLLFFVITTVLLAGVGSYFFLSINQLKKKVQTQFEPQQQTRLLKSLTLDINSLNNQYLNDTIQLSDQYIDSIIHNVEEVIVKIQQESQKLKVAKNGNLDTIPKMLYELKEKNFKLKDLRNVGESDFIFSLEKVIQSEFKNKLLSEKDSIIVTNQITSYIKENKIFNAQPKAEAAEDPDKGFFQRLFKTKDKKKLIIQNEPILELRAPTFLDTTVQQKVDTVNQINATTKGSGIDLFALFDKIQMRRINYINNIQAVEKEIYELNYDINKKIENIINDFILQQYASYEDYLSELKSETGNQASILLFTIIGFTLFSIILIYRFFKDINRNVQYQNTLKIKEEEAVRQAEEKQRFLNTMSHEIRTPLTSIIGYVDLLDGDDKNIRAIKSSANYLYQMTNEILDIAKINMGVIEIQEESIDLTKLLQEVHDNFIPSLESKGLKYAFDIPKTPIYIKTDGQRIQQILYNLIHNAIKFTSQGFVNLKVEVEELGNQQCVTFKVIDSGVGMNAQEQIHVFEDFHQAGTHKSKMKGTGLGLGIVEKLVDLLSGKLQLESEPGKGTTFKLSFNFEKALAERSVNQLENESNADQFIDVFKDKSILIIDDDVLITSLYERILAPTNAKITIYNNPKEAFAEALHGTFDLLIIDYRMPEMTGYQFLNYLKARKETMPKTMIATANAMLDEEAKDELKSFDKVIFKPFNKLFFLNQIATVLDVHLATFHVEPQCTSAKESISFDSLKNYVGDDPQDLIDILNVIVSENDKSLTDMHRAMENKDYDGIAFVIHQLSSRFSQVDESLTEETKEIEMELRNDNPEEAYSQIEQLYTNWVHSQALIRRKLEELIADINAN